LAKCSAVGCRNGLCLDSSLCKPSPGVYRNQPVAVKTIKFRLPSDLDEFLKEVNAMNKLHHPNIGLHWRNFFSLRKQPSSYSLCFSP
jgi:hypothetical protein